MNEDELLSLNAEGDRSMSRSKPSQKYQNNMESQKARPQRSSCGRCLDWTFKSSVSKNQQQDKGDNSLEYGTEDSPSLHMSFLYGLQVRK